MAARTGLALFGVAVAGLACGGSTALRPAPSWISTPPRHSPITLVFVGQAAAKDRVTARELAVGRALTELSKFCGATLSTEFVLVDAERNGVAEQRVQETVRVAGAEIPLEGVVVEETVVQPQPDGFDGYARVRWPRRAYQAFLARRRDQIVAAVAPFEAAEAALARMRLVEAAARLEEARARLGGVEAQVSLDHPRFPHSGVLSDAVEALERRLARLSAERLGRIAVGVDCGVRRAQVDCPAHRVGGIQEEITGAGLAVPPRAVPPDVVRAIAGGSVPTLGEAERSAAHLLAVTFDVEPLGEQDGFVFARCGAQAALVDTDRGEIVDTVAIPPRKGGHLDLERAAERGCRDADAEVRSWLGGVLGRVEASAP